MAIGDTTPYSTVKPLIGGDLPSWVPEEESERIASYYKYDDVYWNVPDTFKLLRRGDDGTPIYVPKPMVVVDTTAYYLLKGLKIIVPDKNPELEEFLENFLQRERFYSKFHTAKHAGVARGDMLLHLTADESKLEGERISFNSVMPHSYFPVHDPDNLSRLLKVFLVEEATLDNKPVVRRLTYEYVNQGEARKVQMSEGFFEVRDWWDDEKATEVQSIVPATILPEPIDRIPLYHFPNKQWDGEPFGRSELSGFERIFAAMNQSMSDEEVALALDGLGIYATDAGAPVDENGNEGDWEIAPGRVMELPLGSYFKRIEGINTLKPMLEHVGALEDFLHDASGTSDVARGQIDVQMAESGIALAIKFIPMLAKIEQRDASGLEVLTNFWYDWKAWVKAYEGQDFTETDIVPIIGEKLPINRTEVLNELNNMLDRKVISKQYYRDQMSLKLDYEFPQDIEQQILDEERRWRELNLELQIQTQAALGTQPQDDSQEKLPSTSGGDPRVTRKFDPKNPTGQKRNRSNNRNRPNESGGTEA